MNLLNGFIKSSNELATSVKKNSPALLIVAGLVGMGATIVMVNKEAPNAKDILDDRKAEREKNEEPETVKTVLEDVKAVAPIYAPAVFTGVASAACIIFSYKISNDRITALATAYTLTEAKLTEYQKKVIETIGEKKEQKIQDEIVKDHLEEAEKKGRLVIEESENDDDGCIWMWDDFTKHKFRANVEMVLRGQDEMNNYLSQGEEVSLNELLSAIGCPESDVAEVYGWEPGDKIDIRFSPHLLADGYTTCTALVYDVPLKSQYFSRY